MTNRSELDLSKLADYIEAHSVREPDLFKALREETAQLPESNMQIAAEQGQFMAMLVQLMGAKRCLEVGTFTGYSALSIATVLPEDGTLICCDISETWTNIGKKYWAEAGVQDKIILKLGDAVASLDELLKTEQGTFDFAFIDADKTNYINYYERALTLMRPGGLITIDNVLWHGYVADDSHQEEDTIAIREFNEKVYQDDRVDISLIPIADGLTLARKK